MTDRKVLENGYQGGPEDGRSPATQGRAATASPPSPKTVSGIAGIPNADVAAVVAELAAQFGPGHSNGVVCILVHPDLPEHFGRKEWAGWQIRPAEAAFAWAHDRGLITPWKLSSKWTFTPLGLATAKYFRTSDSDGSGEAGETALAGSTEGDSAGPKDIAHPCSPSDHPGERA